MLTRAKNRRFVVTKFEKVSDEFKLDFEIPVIDYMYGFKYNAIGRIKRTRKRVRLHFGSIVCIINLMEEYEQDCKAFQSTRLRTKKFSTNQWPSDECVRQCLVSAQIRPGLDTAS